MKIKHHWRTQAQVGVCAFSLAGGGISYLVGMRDVAAWLWMSGACIVLR